MLAFGETFTNLKTKVLIALHTIQRTLTTARRNSGIRVHTTARQDKKLRGKNKCW